ncbi:MAG: FHA domain-containing protein [Pseudomonadota bacterium]
MQYVLVIAGQDGKVRERPLENGETSVGRGDDNALVLEGRGVSRRHAKFVLSENVLMIVDAESTYGTLVNGEFVQRRELHDGDWVTIGMNRLGIHAAAKLPDPSDKKNDSVRFLVDQSTKDPVDDIHQRSTLRVEKGAIRFVLDNPNEQGYAVRVLSKENKFLTQAMEKLKTSVSRGGPPLTNKMTAPIAQTEYQALTLMYKVSQLMVVAPDLDGFIDSVADLVMEEVGATTVVVLMQGEELTPRIIKHRGTLEPGQIPISRGILDWVLREKECVISANVIDDKRLQVGGSVDFYKIRSVIATPLKMRGHIKGVLYLNRAGAPPFSEPDGELVNALAALLASGIESADLKERIQKEKQKRQALERFHPPEVAKRIFESADIGEMEECHVTAMLCNLDGFEKWHRQIEPRDFVRILHEYYELIYEGIFANGGSLLKLHDDWALALFGLGNSSEQDAVWAVDAALGLLSQFRLVAKFWPHGESLGLRCALDTGIVSAGAVGSFDRLEYIATGKPIRTVKSMIGQSQGTVLLVTDETWQCLPNARYTKQEVESLFDRKIYQICEQ